MRWQIAQFVRLPRIGHGSWLSSSRTRRCKGQTLFGLLSDRQPARYQDRQPCGRLQRRIAALRAQGGPERQVMYPQLHEPGEAAQSDFTHMTSLGVTLGWCRFHTWSTTWCWWIRTSRRSRSAFSESFEALVEGFETCVWQGIRGVPASTAPTILARRSTLWTPKSGHAPRLLTRHLAPVRDR